MADDAKGEKKLHVDDGWKEQVQAEKERLDRKAEAAGTPGADQAGRPEAAGEPAGDARAAPRGEGAAQEEVPSMPPARFETLVRTLATQAMIFLSPERDSETGQAIQNLDLAKHSIDLLGVLEEKTRGNLSAAEKQLLDSVLYQTRMAYVQAAR